MLISTFIPGAKTASAFTAFNGIFASFTAVNGIAIPPTTISPGGAAEHSCSPQVTFSPSKVATRRETSSSAFPLSTQARIVRIDPSGEASVPQRIDCKLWLVQTPNGPEFICDLGEPSALSALKLLTAESAENS